LSTTVNNDISNLNENRKIIRPDRRIIVFLFFVFISALFWFLNQLEANYETDIKYPVRFDNFPKNKVIAGNLPEYFTLRVKARGFKILEYKISNTFLPYVVDVSKLTLRFHSSEKTSKFYTLTKFFEDNIESQIGSDFQVLKILPDTLFLEFTNMVTKKVPVVSDIKAEAESQYMIKGKIILDPDSILISGAKPIIDTIFNVHTQSLKLGKLTDDYTDDVDLEQIKNIELSQNKSNVLIKVEKFTEGSQRVDMKTINVPDSIVLRLFPSEITVNYHVGLTDYEKVIPQLFDFVVDFNDVKSETNKLNIKLLNYPDYLQSVRYTPTIVEYIIERK
jgi:hypothetical protein